MVFAKSYCPHCRATRSLLKTMRTTIDFEANVIDLDKMPEEDGALVQMELLRRTGQRTVPNVFIEGAHIGGNSEMQKLAADGNLQGLLSKVVSSRSTQVRANYLRGAMEGSQTL
mmetsp:Transcript_16265/g.37368  ORF Transcript_16265/g.37368 Transcript_16265/m.37368 type:complete len:114 (-) Transcript_16265:1047-1388(-)